MSDVTIPFNANKLRMNPGWIHEIMFLLVREFERDVHLIKHDKLQKIIEKYKYFYSVAGDVFENPTSFDEIFQNDPQLYDLFITTLDKINQKLTSEKNYLTLRDLEEKVDIGIIRYELDVTKLMDKINEVKNLLTK